MHLSKKPQLNSTMTQSNTPDPLSEWMSEFFQTLNADAVHYPAFTRIFQKSLATVNGESNVNALTDHDTWYDPEEPSPVTCRQAVMENTGGIFKAYLSALYAGHTAAFAEACEVDIWLGESEHAASQIAYQKLARSALSSPDDPAYHDAYQACIHQGFSEEHARRCAEFLFDYDLSFPRAKKAAGDYIAAEQKCLAQGYSALRARVYAEQILANEYIPEAVEQYAKFIDDRVANGKTELEARRLVDAFMEHCDRFGPNDESDGA